MPFKKFDNYTFLLCESAPQKCSLDRQHTIFCNTAILSAVFDSVKLLESIEDADGDVMTHVDPG